MNLEDDRNYLLNCLELILDHLCVLMESIICPQVMDIQRSLSLTHKFKHISYMKMKSLHFYEPLIHKL